MDAYAGPVEQGDSLFLILTRHYDEKLEKYTHFEYRMSNRRNNAERKNIQSRYPDAIERGYDGYTGATEFGKHHHRTVAL
jgi:hypothetical protein